MAFRRIILCFLFLLPFLSFAQDSKSGEKIPRVLFLLDGSSSMAEDWTPGKTRFQQARTFILTLLDSLSAANEQVEFGLRVFGHQYPAQERNCYDTKLEIKFSRYSGVQMATRLEALHGYGVSPIAYSLSEAAMEDFENESKYAYSIILVTDGGESCNGDICDVVNKLLQRKIFFKPYIVSLVDYAPLKDLYACLGTFLMVNNPSRQTPVITKIVDGHREGFVRAKTGTVIPVMPVMAKPEPVKVTTPLPKGDTNSFPITYDSATKRYIPIPKQPEAVKPLPVREKQVIKPLRLKSGKRTFKVIDEVIPPTPRPVEVTPFRLSVIGNRPPEPPKPQPRTSLKVLPQLGIRKARNMRLLTVIPSPRSINVRAMELTKFVKETPPVAATSNTAPVKPTVTPTPAATKPAVTKPTVTKPTVTPPAKPSLAPANYTQEKTPAEDTYLEVVFTDGNGRYYSTTPQIQLSDPTTNKPVKMFYRTVDPDGNPDPVQVQAGVYNLSVVGSDKTFLKSVEIAAKTRNKIVITVSSGSLKFVWKGGTNKEPVSKYFAQVKRNFVPQPMVTQRCDTVLPYPPGNYHIEINTVPVSVRSVDLAFGATVIIPIDEPGIVQITNTETLGKATLYYQLGDKFMQFSAINIIGNPGSQSMELLPGLYEIHYTLGSGLPEKVVAFHVYSTKTTSLELK